MRIEVSKLFILLSLVLLSLHWVGCSDEPTSVGLGLLSSQDLVRVDTTTVAAASGTTFRKRVSTGSSGNLLVGKVLGYEARSLLSFSTIPDTLKSATVLSANLVLKPAYRFGPTENILSFSVYKMNTGWTEAGVRWDSVGTTSYEPTIRGEFAKAFADSDSVSVTLDPNLVSGWFQAAGSEPIYGVVLVPTNESKTIVGFNSFQSAQTSKIPYLIVKYSKGGTESTISFSAGQDAFVANIDNLASDPSLIYVQAGVAYRSIVKLDFSTIPQHVGIHDATLELTLKRSPSPPLNSHLVDSLFTRFYLSQDSTDNSLLLIGRRLDPNSDVYSFTITPYVQRWINGRANFGLELNAWTEISSLDLFTFYSASADASLRPRLRVTYSRQL